MRFSLMRRIDQYVGFLLCHFLSWLYGVKRRSEDQKVPQRLKRALVIKFLGFGSIILSTPLMAEIKRNYPNCKIDYLTFSENFPICESIPLIERTHSLERRSLGKFALSVVRILRQIRQSQYDVVFNLEFFSNFSLLLSALSKSKMVLCFGGRHEYSKRLCHKTISYENAVHIIEKFCSFLKALGKEPSGECLSLPNLDEDPESKKRISEILEQYQIQPERDRLILVNINASEMSDIRKWPLDYYVQVCSFLLTIPAVKILLIGGREDVAYVSQLEKKLSGERGRVLNLVGKISLREMISLMRVSYLYFGNDSGPLHVAEAIGLPNVSFYGPESPQAFGHPGDKNHIFYAGLQCSPCINVYSNKDTSCLDNKCLRKIEPAKVIKVLRDKYFKEER